MSAFGLQAAIRTTPPDLRFGPGRDITPPFLAHHATGPNEKRPGNRGAPKIQTGKEPHAAILIGLTSRTLLELAIGIARGFIDSGISRTRSTCRSPFSRLAPLT